MESNPELPLAPRSNQELFDIALNGIRNQGGISHSTAGGCAYRSYHTGNRRACGVGHMIPDNVITEVGDFEGAWVRSIETLKDHGNAKMKNLFTALQISGITKDQLPFLVDVQFAHDDCQYREDPMLRFEKNMRVVAQKYGLTYTPPTA